jgi:hypothetical protein
MHCQRLQQSHFVRYLTLCICTYVCITLCYTAATQFLVKGLHIFAQAPGKDKQSVAAPQTTVAAAVNTDVQYLTQHLVHTRAAQLASTFTQFVCTKEDVHYACSYRDSSTAERSSEQSMPILRYIAVNCSHVHSGIACLASKAVTLQCLCCVTTAIDIMLT